MKIVFRREPPLKGADRKRGGTTVTDGLKRDYMIQDGYLTQIPKKDRKESRLAWRQTLRHAITSHLHPSIGQEDYRVERSREGAVQHAGAKPVKYRGHP